MAKKNRKSLLARFSDGARPSKMDFRDLIESMVHISDDGIERTFADGLRLMQAKSSEDSTSQLLSLFRVDDMQKALWTLRIDPVNGNLQWNNQNAQAALTLARQVGGDHSTSVGVGINHTQPAYECDVAGVSAMQARIGRKGSKKAFADGHWHTIKTNVSGCVALEVTAVARGVDHTAMAIMHTIVTKVFDEKGNFSYHRADDGKHRSSIKLRWIPAENPLPNHPLKQYDLQISYNLSSQANGSLRRFSVAASTPPSASFFKRFSPPVEKQSIQHTGCTSTGHSFEFEAAQIEYYLCDLWFDPDMNGCLQDPQKPCGIERQTVDLGQSEYSKTVDASSRLRKDRKNLLRLFDDGMQPTAADFSALIAAMFNIKDDGMDRSSYCGLQLHQLGSSSGSSKTLMSFSHSEASQQVFWSLNFGTTESELEVCAGNADAPLQVSFGRLGKADPNAGNFPSDRGTYSSGHLGMGIQKSQPDYALDINGIMATTGRLGSARKVLADGVWHSLLNGADTAEGGQDLGDCFAYEVVAGVGKKNSGKYAILHAYALLVGGGKGDIVIHQAHYDSLCDCLELQWTVPEQEGQRADLKIRVASSYYDIGSVESDSVISNMSETVEIHCYVTNLWLAAGSTAKSPPAVDEPLGTQNQESRNALTGFFEAGKLPQEEHFSALIGAMLNLMDDGLERSDIDGLRLRQDAGVTAQADSRLLSIYADDMPEQAVWFMQIDQDSHVDSANSLLLFGAADPVSPLLCLSQRPISTGGSTCRSGVQVGINTRNPNYELDVNGTICSSGRIGRKGNAAVLADGNWHTIRENLYGCNAFEITAGAGKKYSGQYAVMHAFALNAFQSHHHISYHRSHYGAACNRLELRWIAAQGPGSEELFRPYDLQLRVAASYGADIWVQYFVTDLWFDPAMSGATA